MNRTSNITNRPVESHAAGARLETDLRALILSDRLAYDQAITSETTLTETYRISRNTVRKALQNLVDEGLLFKVKGRGTFAVPPEKRRRQSPEGRILAAITNYRFLNPENAYDSHLIIGATEQAARDGVRVDFVDPEELGGAAIAEMAKKGELRGIIWERALESFQPLIAELAGLALPQVTISRWVPGVHSIFFDAEASMAETLQFLHGIGHRKIGMFDLASSLPIFQLRQKSFVAGLELMGVAAPAEHLITAAMVPLQQSADVFAGAGKFTAVVMPSFAVGNFMSWCHHSGLRIPEDLSLIAISTLGSPELSQGVPVSAILEPRYEIGRLAVELVEKLCQGNAPPMGTIKVKGGLLIKQTCTSPKRLIQEGAAS